MIERLDGKVVRGDGSVLEEQRLFLVKDGRKRTARMGSIMDFNIEAFAGAVDESEPVWIDNVAHPMAQDGRKLSLARGTHSVYRDHGMEWDNTGKNGHYASFVWKGP